MNKDRILSVYTDWNGRKTYGGCSYYRCIKPMAKLGVKSWGRIFGEVYPSGVQPADAWADIWAKNDLLFIMKLDNPNGITQVFATKEFFNKRVIVDLDDDYFSIDEWSTAYARVTEEKIEAIKIVLEEADALSVSTHALKKVYSKFNDNIYVNENYIDLDDFKCHVRKRNDGLVHIGWQGSSTHERDLDMIIPALRNVLEKNPHVVFHHLGHDSDIFDQLPSSQHEYVRPVGEFPDFPDHLAAQGWDISIAPLFDMPFNHSKSAIKYYEYSAFKIPSVVTGGDWSPYQGRFKDGHDGFYANSIKEWEQKLTKLIKDPLLRKRMGGAAYANVRDNYTIDKNMGQWEKMMEREYKKSPKGLILEATA